MSRPIWKGSINFGLVNIPIELRMAVHDKTVHFHMLSRDGTCRLRRKLYCPETGKEFDFNQTSRGIEVGPENYVLVDQREINRLKPEKGKSMEIAQFVDLEAIDPVFYERVYYVTPADASHKSYRLLIEAMADAHKCAIARFVMRERQYVAVLRVLDQGLVLHTLHYADEVEPIAEVLPAELRRVKVTTPEMRMASDLIKSMTHPLKIDSFKDEYRERIEELIEAKVKGKETIKVADEEADEPPRTLNLMDALKKSLAQTQRNGHPRTHRGRQRRSA